MPQCAGSSIARVSWTVSLLLLQSLLAAPKPPPQGACIRNPRSASHACKPHIAQELQTNQLSNAAVRCCDCALSERQLTTAQALLPTATMLQYVNLVVGQPTSYGCTDSNTQGIACAISGSSSGDPRRIYIARPAERRCCGTTACGLSVSQSCASVNHLQLYREAASAVLQVHDHA